MSIHRQMTEIDPELMDRAVDAAQPLCFDAVNLVFRTRSNTSGIYWSWIVAIPNDVTVNDMATCYACGSGETLTAALENFIEKCGEAKKNLELVRAGKRDQIKLRNK